MDVLGKQSPFEVVYGRTSNALSQLLDGGLSCQESVSSAARISPRACNFRSNGERARKFQSKAKASNNIQPYVTLATLGGDYKATHPPFTKWEYGLQSDFYFQEAPVVSRRINLLLKRL